jgi:AraC-like DNA-binding protein
MPSATIWTTHLELLAHSFAADREAFVFDVETNADWSWLALEKGRFAFRVGRGKSAVAGECSAGDWVLCPPNEPFQRRVLTPCSFHIIRFRASDNALYALRGRGTLRDGARLATNFAAMRSLWNAPDAAAWKGHLLLDTLRCASWEQHAAVPAAVLHDAVMQQIRATLEVRSGGKVSLAALAQQTHLSPGAFSKRFRASFGISPQEFLLQQRLTRARALLLETDLTLEAIAHRCGFSTGFYLSRLWTKRFGIAPARFRRLHRV